MYNKLIINSLIKFIKENNGKVDKKSLIDLVQKKFSLVKDGKVYCCADFSIRFSSSKKKHMSNTVLALSKLQKYDKKTFFRLHSYSRYKLYFAGQYNFFEKNKPFIERITSG